MPEIIDTAGAGVVNHPEGVTEPKLLNDGENRPVFQMRAMLPSIIVRAQKRWPELAAQLASASELLISDSLFVWPQEGDAVALCQVGGAAGLEWESRFLIIWTAHGLCCRCTAQAATAPAGLLLEDRYQDEDCCPHILALLLATYLRWPVPPFSFCAETLWQAALEELRRQMTVAAFTCWFNGSKTVPEVSTPLSLTVSVGSPNAVEWLAVRFTDTVQRMLEYLMGYEMSIQFVCNTMRNSAGLSSNDGCLGGIDAGNRPVPEHQSLSVGEDGFEGVANDAPTNPCAFSVARVIYGTGDLHYGDGGLVNMENRVEAMAFLQFMLAASERPTSKTRLQAFYRERNLVRRTG